MEEPDKAETSVTETEEVSTTQVEEREAEETPEVLVQI